jgi:hypothetical protein
MFIDKSQKIIEIAKCMKNPIYAIETYLQTEDRTQGGYVPFKLFPKQKKLIDAYRSSQHNLVMKPRQAGISTTTAAYAAIITALASKNSTQKILIAANKQETAKEFLKKIKEFTQQLPDWMDVYRPDGAKNWFDDSKNSSSHYKLWNGSEVKAVASSKDALRGYTPSLIIVDEAAFIEGNRGEEFYTAAQPSLSTGGKSILISCVTEDTFVITPQGIKTVKDFIDKSKIGGYEIDEYEILGHNKFRKSNLFHNNGFVKTKIIKTTNTELEGSHNHKLYAFSGKKNEYGWFRLDELNVGDYIPLRYNTEVWGDDDDCSDFNPSVSKKIKNIFSPNKITPEISYFMGLFLAKGSNYKTIIDGKHLGTSITISCGDDVSDIMNSMGLNYYHDNKFHYTISCKNLGEFLEYIGFDLSLKVNKKVIPDRIFRLSRENVVSFVRGFMDGYSRSDNGKVGLCSSSKKLIKQFRALLMNFGILTEYQEVLTKPTKIVKVESMNYRLNITSKEDNLRYYNKIGFAFQRKQQKKENLKLKKIRNTHDVIPTGVDIIKKLYQESGLGLKYFKDLGCDLSHITKNKRKRPTNTISREMVLDFLKILGQTKELVDENIKWCRINEISDSENETYDFSLPEDINDFWCHSVLYNNIIGHQTPNGQDPLYYVAYVNAKKGINNFNVLEMRWYEDPRYNKDLTWFKKEILNNGEEHIDYQEEWDKEKWEDLLKTGWMPTSSWYENMCAQLNHNPRSIAQELNCDFVGSGDQVIDDKYVENQKNRYVKDPIRKEWIDGNMWIWEDPVKDHRYIIAADPSSGSSDDWAGVWVLDYDTGNQVAEYHGKVAPDVLGEIVAYYGKSYNAFAVVDTTGGYGVSTVLKMIELGYPTKNMYYDSPIGIDALENNKQMLKYMSNGKMPGINFQKSRNTIIMEGEKAVRMASIKIRSIRTLSEIPTFVYVNNRPDHQKGSHDDLLMCLFMTNFVGMTSFKDLEKSKGQAKAMIDSWVSTETSVNVMSEIQDTIPGFYTDNKHQTIKQTEEYSWLFSGFGQKNKRRR